MTHTYVTSYEYAYKLFHTPIDDDFFERHIVLIPVPDYIYELSVQEFLEICNDAETNGLEVHYIGGQLYYADII